MNGEKRCGGRTRAGGTCKNPAGYKTVHVGSGRCKYHAGGTPGAALGAAREVAREQIRERRLLGLAEPRRPVNPVDVLLDEVALSDVIVRWIGDALATWGEAGAAEQPVGTAHALSNRPPPLQQVSYRAEAGVTVAPTELAAWLREFRAEREHRRRVAVAASSWIWRRGSCGWTRRRRSLLLRIVDRLAARLGIDVGQAQQALPAVILEVQGEDTPAAAG